MHPHPPPFVVSGPQQLDFSAGAQQAVRSSGVQQPDCEVVLSLGAGETMVPVVRAMAALVAADGRDVRDESMDMDEPRVAFAGVRR